MTDIRQTKKSRRLTWSSIPKFLVNVLIIFYSLSCVVPLLWMLNSSFRTNGEFMSNIIGLASHPRFENYSKAVSIGKMGSYVFNSAYLTVITVAVGTIMAFVVAYFLARFHFAGHGFVYYLFLIGMIVPTLSLMIPVFMQFKVLHLRDKWFTLLFPYIAYSLPMSILLFQSYIKSLPRELDEAAMLDGCSKSRLMFRIILPLCKPIMSIIVVWNFMNTWNEFPFALVLLKNPGLYTIAIGIRAFNQQYTMDYPLFMAALLVATVPVIIVYCCLSKKVMESMTAGAVKF